VAPPSTYGGGSDSALGGSASGGGGSSGSHWELLRHARKLHSTVREALRSSTASPASGSSSESPGRLHVAASAAAAGPTLPPSEVDPPLLLLPSSHVACDEAGSVNVRDERAAATPLVGAHPPATATTTAASRRLSIVAPQLLLPCDAGWTGGAPARGGGGCGGGGWGGQPPLGDGRSPARRASFEERLVYAPAVGGVTALPSTPPLITGGGGDGGGGSSDGGGGSGGDGEGPRPPPRGPSSLAGSSSSWTSAQRELAAAVSQLEMAATFRGLLLRSPSASGAADAGDSDTELLEPGGCVCGAVSFVPAAALTLTPLLPEGDDDAPPACSAQPELAASLARVHMGDRL
jgi:hypothetical protein